MANTDAPKASSTAAAREDFIKRLFAVTLSVGIANQLSHVMLDPNVVQSHHIAWHPIIERWRELLLLLISLAVVVSSWEGYLKAVLANPLEDTGRFMVDIAWVFTYLVMTLSTEDADAWFLIHVIIFFEYAIWDTLRTRLPNFRRRDRLYKESLVITIVWLLYFLIIFALKEKFSYFGTESGFLAISFAALMGVFLYRHDKDHREKWTWVVKGLVTAGIIGSLIALAIVGSLIASATLPKF